MTGGLVARLLAALRALAEAMTPLRGEVRFTDEQDVARKFDSAMPVAADSGRARIGIGSLQRWCVP